MKRINMALDSCKDICEKLRNKLDTELTELDTTDCYIRGTVFDDIECCAVLTLPNFYCYGEQCNFVVNITLIDTTDNISRCSASISGYESLNTYYSDTCDNFDYADIDEIISNFFNIISNWVNCSSENSYMVSFDSPILKYSDCIPTQVFSSISGDVMLNDIKSDNKYLPDRILACDGVSIVDGVIDQIVVIFMPDVTDDSHEGLSTVLLFRGFSNFSDRAKDIIYKEEPEAFELGSLDIKRLAEDETINSLPAELYRKLRFCSDQLGLDISKYVGYAECDNCDESLVDCCYSIDEYSLTVIVNGEPEIQN